MSATRRYLQVALQILEGIGSGATPLGSKLPADRELAGMMGVSRLTVREAVLALEVVGVLQVRTGDGTYVTHDGAHSSQLGGLLSHKEFPVPTAEVLEARSVVEPAAVALVAQRATPEQLDELEDLLEHAEDLTHRVEDLGEFVSVGLQFHASLVRLCGNAHLAAFLNALVDLEEHPLWTLLNAHAMQNLDARRSQVAEHRQILTEIRAGNASRASALMAEHLGHLAVAVEALSDLTNNSN
ncbi:FadR family transcriptional regulator [Nocardioides agariphilus]|uniref:FadR family transcriptional regulator n=1 Tax=Nocardioides agariphilus TaxID=433664 RepID=A0A930YJJ0_9ACTN|nr:FadR family transcriptional regulator [Nocardioides agariphilus]